MMELAPYEIQYVRRKVLSRGLIDGRARTSLPEYPIWTGMIARCHFRDLEGRKVSVTKPENRAKHVDRLARAWNLASVDARVAFLEQANAEPRADMPRLLKSRRGFAGRKPAPQPNEGQAA